MIKVSIGYTVRDCQDIRVCRGKTKKYVGRLFVKLINIGRGFQYTVLKLC